MASKQDLCREAVQRRAGQRKVLIFQLDTQDYGISLDLVLEILPMALLSRPPGLPRVLAGFLDLGGAAVPVLRLAELFGVPERATGLYSPLVVMRLGEQTAALLVEAVEGIATVDETTITPFFENDCATGLVTIGKANVILLSSEQLLRCQEERCLRELTAIEQSRLAGFQEAGT